MAGITPDNRPTEITVIVLLIASLLLLPPILGLWANPQSAWYLPYLVWFGIICLSFALQKRLNP